jgi:hypothetical protein
MNTVTTNTTKPEEAVKTLNYYSGNIGLGLDPAPKGEWENGIFTLGEDDDGFLAGEKFVLSEDDSHDQSSLDNGTGGYNLEALR